MNAIEYIQTQTELLHIAKTVALLPVQEFVCAINNAETVSSILDSTLYRRAAENLAAIKELAAAFITVQNAHAKLLVTLLDTAVREGSTVSIAPGLHVVADVSLPPDDAS